MYTNSASAFAAVGISVLLLTACGGGGGGGGPAANLVATSSSASSNNSSSSNGSGSSTTFGSGSTDTNLFRSFTTGSVSVNTAPGSVPTITSPAAATVGSNTTPLPNGSQPLNGTAFPLKQSVINVNSSGIGPDVVANNGGATLSVLNWNASGDSQFRLTIPGVGLDATFTSSSLLKGPSTVAGGTFRLTASNANYAALGLWEVDTTSATAGGATENKIHLGAFTTGFETPVSALPTSGVATYAGAQSVAGLVTSNSSSGVSRASLIGDASFSANFGTGAITGSFTNMIVTASPGFVAPTPWNSVSVTSSLIAGTSRFSGSTAAASAPNAPYVIGGSATGRIDGGFYGPNANELGAVWSLSDGQNVVVGTAQGAHQ